MRERKFMKPSSIEGCRHAIDGGDKLSDDVCEWKRTANGI